MKLRAQTNREHFPESEAEVNFFRQQVIRRFSLENKKERKRETEREIIVNMHMIEFPVASMTGNL